MFERAPGFLEVVFGDERAEQFNRGEQPAGFHARGMNRFFGKAFLASLEPFPVAPPLDLERIAQMHQHVLGRVVAAGGRLRSPQRLAVFD